MKKILTGILMFLGICCFAQPNPDIEHVYVVFKTHLDVGFTDLSSKVTDRYMNEFIPKALDVADQMRADGSGDRYVWITGSWLIWKYLETADPEDKARLEEALRRGDIVWNGVPYTLESETTNRDLFETLLLPAKILDKKYGKKTIAAKMTDVPGHTRSIISPLSDAGIQFLHVGVNPASPVPSVPKFCLWRDTNGKEIVLVYQGDYGSNDVMPDGKTVLSFNFTSDNHGPHTYEQVKEIYANLRKNYPNAKVEAKSLNDIAAYLVTLKDKLPVVTSEIGDTWVFGYAGSPIRMAKYRAILDLYSRWLAQGRINMWDKSTINFALELGLIPEHTQGVDVKTYIKNWDKYDMDPFIAYRNSDEFRYAERSWKELDDYIDNAIAYLPEDLREEAQNRLDEFDNPEREDVPETGNHGNWSKSLFGGALKIDGLTYSMYDSKDYDNYLNNYLRARLDWAFGDMGKPGLDKTNAVSMDLKAQIVGKKVDSDGSTVYRLAFPEGKVDDRVFPKEITVKCKEYPDKGRAEIELTVLDKPAVRLPEGYWLKFNSGNIKTVIAEKVGERVDLSDVVEGGSRWEHGIDRYIDVVTSNGTFRIISPEAFLIDFGKRPGIDYTTQKTSFSNGISFNLSNNLWGTNFQMWNEGSLTYHFTIEKL
jgi:hypothetical protein